MDVKDGIGKEQLFNGKSITFGESLAKDYEVWRSHIILYVLSTGNRKWKT